MDAHNPLGHVPGAHLRHPRTPVLARELADNPEPGSREWIAAATLEALTHLNDNLRQTFTDKLWQSIPSFVEEQGRSDAWAAGAPVQWPCEFYELVRIEAAVVSIPAGCVGTLQLGSHLFPNLPAGITNLDLGKLLDGGSTRTLTLISGPGGQATVALYGHQLPTTGNMSP